MVLKNDKVFLFHTGSIKSDALNDMNISPDEVFLFHTGSIKSSAMSLSTS